MKRLLKFLTAGFLFSSCALQQQQHVEVYLIEGEFEPYVQNFMIESSDRGRPITITDLKVEFGDTPSMNETGVCEITEGETPIITVNRRIWDTLTPMDRQEVLFHELGHCVLRRNHQEGLIVGVSGSSVPRSIMYPYRIPASIYVPNSDHYHQELFSVSNEF